MNDRVGYYKLFFADKGQQANIWTLATRGRLRGVCQLHTITNTTTTTTEEVYRHKGMTCRRYSASSVTLLSDRTIPVQDDERYKACIQLTKKLLAEDNFAVWEKIIKRDVSDVSSLDVLLHDWDEYVQKPLQIPLDDLVLFSNLCLRVTRQASARTFQWRALLLGLTMWSRLAVHDTMEHNKSSVEIMFHHARQLFEAVPPLIVHGIKESDLRFRQTYYLHAFPVYSRSNHLAASQHCYEILQQAISEDKALMASNTTAFSKEDKETEQHRLLSAQHFERTLVACAKNGEETLFRNVQRQMNAMGWTDTSETYDNLMLLLFVMHGRMSTAQNSSSSDTTTNQPLPVPRDIPGEALQHWQKLLALYQLDPSQVGEPKSNSLIKLIHMHREYPDKSLEILRDAIHFVGDQPACQGMINGLIVRRVLRTLKEHGEPDKADQLWNYVTTEFNRGNTNLKPMPEHYSLLTQVHVEAQDFDKAKMYLAEMEESESESAWSYNVYLKGLLDYRFNMDEMLEIVNRMTNNPRPNTSPTVDTYETMMHAWAKNKGPNAVRKIHELFQLAITSIGKEEQLRTSIYTIAMSSWTRSLLPEALDRCREIFHHIESPEIIHYNLMLRAFAHAGHMGEADAMLWDMLMGDDVTPNKASFTSVIGAYSDMGDNKRSMELFETMIRTAKRQGQSIDPEVWPDPYIVERILRSNPKTLLPNAQRIWKLVENSGMDREADLLASILKILGECDDVEGALECIFDFVTTLDRPFPHSDKVAWQAIHTSARLAGVGNHPTAHYPPPSLRQQQYQQQHQDDQQIISDLFHECCRTGQVGHQTLDAFRTYMRPHVYRRLTLQSPDRQANVLLLPEDWRRNVQEVCMIR
jgi:pentatricopeptide repeat protein